MKKKKRKNENESDKRMARFVAQLKPASHQYFQERAREAAHHLLAGTISDRHTFGMLVCSRNPAKFLQLVVDELKGKFHGGKFDNALLKAYEKALVTGKQRDERSVSLMPLFSEVYDALVLLSGRSPVPTERYARRRLKVMRYGLSEKRHRNPKSKFATAKPL